MNSVYIHIPFCQNRCFYCDFYTQIIKKSDDLDLYVQALLKELDFRQNYLQKKYLKSIYFGGGTPSLLNIKHFEKIFSALSQKFSFSPFIEITIEANPEDLTFEFLSDLKAYTPVNRLSVGVQSFFDDDLKFLNRSHSGDAAKKALENALKSGFENLSVDLIYGFKTLSLEKWIKNLEFLTRFAVKHFSAYALMIEQGSIFYVLKQKGKKLEIDDEKLIDFLIATENFAKKNNFIHYEISNFAQEKFYSKHNWFYWTGGKYLGLGASAHSYDGKSRQWNIANYKKYTDALLKQGKLLFEKEELTEKDFFNEYIITRLRTFRGIDLIELQQISSVFFEEIKSVLNDFVEKGFLIKQKNRIRLSEKGILISDTIMRDLIVLD